MPEPITSTGRGGECATQPRFLDEIDVYREDIGAGNIGHDPHVYTDGGITRQGPVVAETDGILSTGRGGTRAIYPDNSRHKIC